MKKVLVIRTSLRQNSNSDILAQAFAKGARDQGHDVTIVSLKDKHLKYCIGCLSCQKTQRCVLQDDMADILEMLKSSDVVAFATPIYYYEMSGQMKTLLDRTNPLYTAEYAFRDVYALMSAAETEERSMDRAIQGLQGWIDCYEKAQLKGVVRGLGLSDGKEAETRSELLQQAYALGASISQ